MQIQMQIFILKVIHFLRLFLENKFPRIWNFDKRALISQTSNWSGTIFGCFLQQTGLDISNVQISRKYFLHREMLIKFLGTKRLLQFQKKTHYESNKILGILSFFQLHIFSFKKQKIKKLHNLIALSQSEQSKAT